MKSIIKPSIYRILSLVILIFICKVNALATFYGTRTASPVTNGTAYSFAEDEDGFVWAGLLGKLVRYDGLRTLEFPIPANNATSLRTNAIVQLGRDSLLLAGDFGLKIFDRSTLEFVDSLPSHIKSVYAMKRIDRDHILIGHSRGLVVLSDSSLDMDTIVFPGAVNYLSYAVYDIDQSPDSTLWITTNYGIFKSAHSGADQSLNFEHVTGGPSDYFPRIAATDNHVYAYATGGGARPQGVYSYNIGTDIWTSVHTGNKIVTSLMVRDSLLYVAADNAGVSVFSIPDNKPVVELNTSSRETPIASNGVYSQFVDSRDNLYIGYFQNGIQSMSPNRVTTFTPYGDGNRFTTDGTFVRATARRYPYQLTASRDKVWITDERTHTTRLIEPGALNNCQPVDILPLDNGMFALGAFSGGVFLINPTDGSVRHIADSGTLRVCDLESDPNGRIWIAAVEGVYRLADGKLDKVFNSSNSDIKSCAVRVYFDRTGRGWITTQEGMFIYDPASDRLLADVFPKGFIDRQFVRCIAEDADGNLLMAYDRNKLFRTDPGLKKFSPLPHHLPISLADINVLQQLPDSSWIVGTSDKLYRTKTFDDYKAYSLYDGIANDLINPGHVYDSEGGRLYLATGDGLRVADMTHLMAEGADRMLTVSEIRYNGERMEGNMPRIVDNTLMLDIPPHTGTIDIFFTDFTSSPEKPDLIEYRAEEDSVWSSRPITRPISLHNGKTLNSNMLVRLAGNPDSTLRIMIRQPMAGTFTWIVAIIILAIVLGSSALYYRHYRNNKQNASIDTPVVPTAEAIEPQSTASIPDETATDTAKYRNLNISEAELARMSKRLDLLLYDSKIYRQPDLKISQVAEKLGVNTALLSYYFSQHLKSNYYRYINSYRIKEFKDMVAQGAHHTYTLSAMSQMCGFSSRTSFFRYFKETEGISPLDYIKRNENVVEADSK